jgi:hypothetical protein
MPGKKVLPGVPTVESGLCLKIPSSARERAVFRLAKTAKQAMLVLSSMELDAVRRTTAAAFIRQWLR